MYRPNGGKIPTMDDAQRAALRAKYESPTPSFALPPGLRSPWAGLWAVILVLALAYLLSLRMSLQRCDDFFKVIGAWSLASGKGYSDISRPDAPFLTKYPPLASLALVPFMELVGEHLRPLRLLSMLAYLASVPLMYRLLLPRAGHRRTLLVLLLAGLNPLTLRGLNFEGGLGLMVLCFVGTVALIEAPTTQRGRNGVVLGILLALCFYCHRIGIVLGGGSLLYLWFVSRERRLALQAGAIFGLFAFPWLLRSYLISGHWISPEYENEIGSMNNGAATRTPGPLGAILHIFSELGKLPGELGYRLFPWSRASGGEPWPFLKGLGLTWVASLSEWLVTVLVVVGWGKSLQARRLSDIYLILHTLMLLAFFFGLQYFLPFFAWLYLFLADGATKLLSRLWSKTAKLGYLAILLILLAKDAKAFWLMPFSLTDRDMRWAWISQTVPTNEAVYYLGLDNYSFSQLRYFDSGFRMAVGLTEKELDAFIIAPPPQAHWLCLPRSSPWSERLAKAGWKPIIAEPDNLIPDASRINDAELSAAQRSFIASIAPPQGLWERR